MGQIEKDLRAIISLKQALKNPAPVLKQIGILGVRTAQRAFKEQKLGPFTWPEKYPGMSAPFLNIAGALEDFSSGRASPSPDRFRNRPAVVHLGAAGGILGRLTYRVTSSDSVEYGSKLPYAGLQNDGGISTQPITDAAKKLISEWLFPMAKKLVAQSFGSAELKKYGDKFNKFTPKRQAKMIKQHGSRDKAIREMHKISDAKRQQRVAQKLAWRPFSRKKQKSAQAVRGAIAIKKSDWLSYGRSAYASKLEPLLSEDVFTQRVIPRPFVGITAEVETKIIKTIEMTIEKEQRGQAVA